MGLNPGFPRLKEKFSLLWRRIGRSPNGILLMGHVKGDKRTHGKSDEDGYFHSRIRQGQVHPDMCLGGLGSAATSYDLRRRYGI